MYCPCWQSIWKRFIDYVLIEGLSAKTAPTYLANFPMRAEIWSLAFLGVRKQMKIDENGESNKIDLCPDMAAILNQLNLRSIMGCPGGTRSVFTCAFRAKRELQCIFLGKKASVITSKDGTTIFFSHYNLFLGKLKEKLARKARVNTDASISDRAHAPWASHNTP